MPRQPGLPDRDIHLTGAQTVALGSRIPGVMGSDKFRDRVAKTSQQVGENGWPMPLPDELKDDLKSTVADLANVSGQRFAGMLVAGAFLREFVADGVDWAHIDIAGPAYNTDSPWGIPPKAPPVCQPGPCSQCSRISPTTDKPLRRRPSWLDEGRSTRRELRADRLAGSSRGSNLIAIKILWKADCDCTAADLYTTKHRGADNQCDRGLVSVSVPASTSRLLPAEMPSTSISLRPGALTTVILAACRLSTSRSRMPTMWSNASHPC